MPARNENGRRDKQRDVMKKVKEMPAFNRPREKLREKGAKALSDKELLAILLGSGTQTQDVLTLAGRTLKILDDTSANPTLEQLQAIDGIGPAKATTSSCRP